MIRSFGFGQVITAGNSLLIFSKKARRSGVLKSGDYISNIVEMVRCGRLGAKSGDPPAPGKNKDTCIIVLKYNIGRSIAYFVFHSEVKLLTCLTSSFGFGQYTSAHFHAISV